MQNVILYEFDKDGGRLIARVAGPSAYHPEGNYVAYTMTASDPEDEEYNEYWDGCIAIDRREASDKTQFVMDALAAQRGVKVIFPSPFSPDNDLPPEVLEAKQEMEASESRRTGMDVGVFPVGIESDGAVSIKDYVRLMRLCGCKIGVICDGQITWWEDP